MYRFMVSCGLVPVVLLCLGTAGEELRADPEVKPFVDGQTVVLQNDRLRIEFHPASVADPSSVRTAVLVKRNGQWQLVDADPEAEQYVVTQYPAGVRRKLNLGHELFNRTQLAEWEVPSQKSSIPSIIDAGRPLVFRPREARVEGSAVVLEFHAQEAGRLEARWSLEPGLQIPKVDLSFVPTEAGIYSLGYKLFWQRDMEQVAELLLPSLYLRRGLPEDPVTLLDPYMSTPMGLIQARGEPSWTFAVVGDPSEIPYQWPDGHKPHLGIMLKHADGLVQPAISGPAPETEGASAAAGEPMTFSFRVLVTDGDWYAGYRTVVDHLFGLTDYRKNWEVSLSDAVYNMIDLFKDDKNGGWWELGKGPYQIESRNTVTHAAPTVSLSIYRLTGDIDYYRNRAIPSIEFCLSRNSFHFAPVQLNQKQGGYLKNAQLETAMRGPVKGFAATTYAAMWELSNRRIQALGDLAVPGGTTEEKAQAYWVSWDKRKGGGWLRTAGIKSIAKEFDSLSEVHVLTGDPRPLERARKVADVYIDRVITEAPTQPHTGFWDGKLPNWEGLLRLYELTGEKRYLEAATFGAHQLMAGIWTQPKVPDGDRLVTVHEEQYRERHDALWLWRGDDRHRLGYRPSTGNLPRMPEPQDVPAWLVSNVGLGYEGEGSDNDPRAPLGRYIFQSVWAPSFLKLAQYTGEQAFETYARNAVIGRFANYPGYYMHGRVSLQNDPQYPYKGPDFTYFYHHHIPVHLGWCIDYLVSDAMRHSAGAIHFPSLRQTGYAFFNFRVYGHAPGTVFDHDDVWLWFDRDLVSLDQAQFNYVTAHDGQRLFVMIMNQDQQPQIGTLRANAGLLGVSELTGKAVTILDAAGGTVTTTTSTAEQVARVEVPARDMRVVVLHEVRPQVATHRIAHPETSGSGVVSLNMEYTDANAGSTGFTGFGAPLQVMPGFWRGYVWLDANREQVRRVTLRYSGDGGRTFSEQTRDQYPYEFTLPRAGSAPLEFEIKGQDWDGNTFSTAGRQTIFPAQ